MPTDFRTRTVPPALPYDQNQVCFGRAALHPEAVRIEILGPRGGFNGVAYVNGDTLARKLAELGFGVEEQSKGQKG